jgi:hypothetical protein
MSEFVIYQIWAEGSDRALLYGRCSKGDISVGTVFGFVYDIVFDSYETSGQNVNTRRVELTVDRIVAYGHELDELNEGITAELAVSGRGLEQLNSGSALSSALAVRGSRT